MSFDFDAAVQSPFRMQPGLRRLGPGSAPQLTPAIVPNRGAARHLREKLAVMWAYPQQALMSTPGFDAEPALQALAAHAAAEHPQAFELQADGGWFARWLGWQVSAEGQPSAHDTGWPEIGPFLLQLPVAWRRPALLMLAFAEDLAIVDGATGTLPWLAVALPSMWAPEEKIGRHFTEVHAPVADNRLVINAAEHLIKLVTGAERWERFVWTLTGERRLHAHPQRLMADRWPTGLTADTVAAHCWWRTERQTFIPLRAATGPQAVFTIHVQTAALHQAITTTAQAAQLHDALASMSEAVLAYRSLAEVRAPLLAWLSRRAQPGA